MNLVSGHETTLEQFQFSDHVCSCIQVKPIMDKYSTLDDRTKIQFRKFFASRYYRAFQASKEIEDETVQICFLIALNYYTMTCTLFV